MAVSSNHVRATFSAASAAFGGGKISAAAGFHSRRRFHFQTSDAAADGDDSIKLYSL